ncbi:hypothetical protein TIFTF001_026838 [Ficus carica]|uniref:PROP1-like PPR domain-containing protein n=1 Tax=Ficus carica TaxID=3494 RepID=A0AA88DLY0_FICCA|nr:hypothetical protein TIFTF001_026838 [Ficus carica]
MWALRRASVSLRNRGFSIRASGAAFSDSELRITYKQDNAGSFDSPELISDRCVSLKGFYRGKHVSTNHIRVRRSLSSQARAKKSDKEDELEEGFSELEATDSTEAVQDTNSLDESVHELILDPDFSEVDDDYDGSKNDLGVSDNSSERVPSGKRVVSVLFKVIASGPAQSVGDVLDKWVKEGNEVEREEVYSAFLALRKTRMYGKAFQVLQYFSGFAYFRLLFLLVLQFSEWLEARKKIEFFERDYASRVDLIAKVQGLEKAEKYIDRMPKSFRGEIVYRTLLANTVQAGNVKKSEEVFNKMKDLGLPVTSFAYNQLILLYKRIDRKKIADVLLMMEKANMKPSIFTYKLLIDIKGQHNDITGMEQIIDAMKSEGIEPDTQTKYIIVKHYASAGLKEKAEAALKALEGGNLKVNRQACRSLLQIYGELGRADEVERVWKICESNPRAGECIAAIQAWGKLKKIEKAEAVFEKMLKAGKKYSQMHYNMLLDVYANNKMLTKGKDLIKRMADSGCKIGPLTWDSLVKLYLDAGEIEKADAVLQKATQQNELKPLFRTYAAVMDHHARRGDIHNTEKIFHRLKQAGYSARLPQFQTLVKAYVIAKSPAYGMGDRLKADNVFPNRALLGQLGHVDPFRKTAVSDLLD